MSLECIASSRSIIKKTHVRIITVYAGKLLSFSVQQYMIKEVFTAAITYLII